MWPLKSAKINTFSQKQIESHIFNIFRLPELSTRHCQSPRTHLLVYNYLHWHFHRDHYCLRKNRDISHLRWLPRVFTNNASYLAYVTERNLVTLSLRFCSRDSPLRLPI